MAHITEFRIDGLLGRTEPVHCKLRRDVNVIFGDNGSGKTTLLKILDAAMNLDSEAIAKLPVTRAEVHIFSLSEKRVVKQIWDRNAPQTLNPVQLELGNPEFLTVTERLRWWKMQESGQRPWKRVPQKDPSEKGTLRWSHAFLPTTRLYIGDKSLPAAQSLSEEQLDAAFAQSLNRAWLLFNSRTVTEVSAIQQEGLRAVLYSALTPTQDKVAHGDLNPDEAYGRVQSFLKRQTVSASTMLGSLESFRARYRKEEELRRVVANLDTVERRVEAALAPTERFFAALRRLFSAGKLLSPLANELSVVLESGQRLPIAALSSGEKHLLKLLLTAMTSEANAVMIDEPELSMHIDWQRQFISTVHALNPECQLILATHSPEIMAEVDDDKIFKI